MLNRVVLVGRLTKDPELRYTPNGVAVANFTLAVNRTFTNQQGERDADFINCVVWRRQAENVANFLKKGSLAGVDGRIQTRSFDNQEGRRVFITEVVAESVQFLEPKGATGSQASGPSYDQDYGSMGGGFGQDQNQQRQNNTNYSKPQNDNPFGGNEEKIDISDDDLPF
ncbi:single-stranded DNA-binding protein [Bacillus tianshenii]|nr:single-stranded DNA-binding protein [Bacillus tianshenii]